MSIFSKTITATIFFLLATVINLKGQQATEWGVDKSHSSVNFEVNHLLSSVNGRFKDFDGKVFFDPSNLKGSSASFTVQVSSVDTDEEDRNSHLLSEDFFDAEKYPEIRFVSTSIDKKSDNQYFVKGRFTMRGITKSITLQLKITGTMASPWVEGQTIMGATINTTLDRTDYEVGTGSWAATAIVGDEVRITVNLEMQTVN